MSTPTTTTTTTARSLAPLSMCGRIRRALLVSPDAAGWARGGDRSGAASWRDLGYRHAPDVAAARRQHEQVRAALREGGVDLVAPEPPETPAASDLSLDAVYCHDASFPTPRGIVLMRMGKEARRAEPDWHREICDRAGIPVIGRIEPPGIAEGGDLVWLDERTVLAGEGYRTNAAGIDQLARLLARDGVTVVTAPLPHGGGPEACLHLMSLLSVLDRKTLVLDPRWLAVRTLEFLLRDRGFGYVPIVEAERDSMAANVLALGDGELLAIAANRRTNDRLRAAGFRVRTYEGSEISQNGSGGPTCLTRPILREAP